MHSFVERPVQIHLASDRPEEKKQEIKRSGRFRSQRHGQFALKLRASFHTGRTWKLFDEDKGGCPALC